MGGIVTREQGEGRERWRGAQQDWEQCPARWSGARIPELVGKQEPVRPFQMLGRGKRCLRTQMCFCAKCWTV